MFLRSARRPSVTRLSEVQTGPKKAAFIIRITSNPIANDAHTHSLTSEVVSATELVCVCVCVCVSDQSLRQTIMVDDEKPIRFGRSRRRRAEMEPGQRTKEKKTEKTDAVCGKGRNECVLESDRPFYLTFGLRHTHTERERERM